MNGDRLRIALVGRGSELNDLLAGLDARSRFLRLQISHVVDLDSAPDNSELCRQLALPAPAPEMVSLQHGPQLGMVVARSLTPAEEQADHQQVGRDRIAREPRDDVRVPVALRGQGASSPLPASSAAGRTRSSGSALSDPWICTARPGIGAWIAVVITGSPGSMALCR